MKLLDIMAWGTLAFGSSAAAAFSGCVNLVGTATDRPDLTGTTSTSQMFSNAVRFNAPIGNWITNDVRDMSAMFQNAEAFNQPIGAWNTEKVTNMSSMFLRASRFDQPIGGWRTGSVTTMQSMFNGASSFAQEIRGPSASVWDTSKVTNMSRMFQGATKLFAVQRSTRYEFALWNVGSLTDASAMFGNPGESDALYYPAYDVLIQLWSRQNLKPGVQLGAGNSWYSDTSAVRQARAKLIADRGWTLHDKGVISSTVLQKCPKFPSCAGANLREVDLSGMDIAGIDFSAADLTRAKLVRARLTRASLVRANLTRVNANRADFRRANLAHSIRYKWKHKGAKLAGAKR